MRQAAVHVWKSIVVNTPKTLRTVLPRLLAISIEAIASSSAEDEDDERQAMASRCLGELVRKMGKAVRLNSRRPVYLHVRVRRRCVRPRCPTVAAVLYWGPSNGGT